MRRRLDADLVRRGLAPSRALAQELIAAGRVVVAGAPAHKAARLVDPAEPVRVEGPARRYVGRGGDKLAGALDRFELDPGGLVVLDAGASTGGFTDCLLQHGAAAVTALDVGYGQLHERVRSDARVTVMERTNLRHVDPAALGPFDAVVADLSFISVRQVMGVLLGCCRPGGWLVVLVKPQFEAGRSEVSRGRGVIGDPEVWSRVLREVIEAARAAGATIEGLIPSPLRGADGNVEFLLHLARPVSGAPGDPAPGVEDLVDAAVAEVGT